MSPGATYVWPSKPLLLRKVNEIAADIGSPLLEDQEVAMITFGPIWSPGFRRRVVEWLKRRKQPQPRERKPRAPTDRSSFVYFIRGGDMIKIGYAKDPKTRLRDLQVGSPVRLEILVTIPGCHSVEKGIHARFRKLRSHGEWFRAEESLLDFVEEMKRRQSR